MSKTEILDREQNLGRKAGLLGLLAVVLLFASQLIPLGDVVNEDTAESLAAVPDNRSNLLIASLLTAFAQILMAAPLWAMFEAASARSTSMRRALIGLTIAGPIFAAAATVTGFFALDAAADAFLDPAAGYDLASQEDADAALDDQGVRQLALGLGSAAGISLVIAIVYTSLNAMRVGLLSRFWGTLSMALGVALLLPGFSLLSLPIVIGAFSLLLSGLWPGSRPLAWETGQAEDPTLRPGGDDPEDGEEQARPEDFEGTGTEVVSERPGRRDNRRKRKRKQRGS
jgi:hypothetical protein